MIIKKITATALWCILAFPGIVSCSGNGGGFSKEELELIHGSDSIMRVLTIEDPADIFVLRASSSDLPAGTLLSSDYRRLAELMVATVTHPSQDGVGIAGPQVGLNRRVVAVQRFDKEQVLRGGRLDYPFEVYPNVRILWASDSLAAGPEGCLSVPGRRGDVLRSQEIVIEYADLSAFGQAAVMEAEMAGMEMELNVIEAEAAGMEVEVAGVEHSDMMAAKVSDAGKQTSGFKIPVRRDTVSGFTAVIFQHEIDHLDGVLYIDHLK